MASQYEKYKKNYDKYVKNGGADQKIVAVMNKIMNYANTIDLDKVKTANDILNGNTGE